jgi:hypothetical protein
MSNSNLKSIGVVPEYPDVKLYANVLNNLVVWEADLWNEGEGETK